MPVLILWVRGLCVSADGKRESGSLSNSPETEILFTVLNNMRTDLLYLTTASGNVWVMKQHRAESMV